MTCDDIKGRVSILFRLKGQEDGGGSCLANQSGPEEDLRTTRTSRRVQRQMGCTAQTNTHFGDKDLQATVVQQISPLDDSLEVLEGVLVVRVCGYIVEGLKVQAILGASQPSRVLH